MGKKLKSSLILAATKVELIFFTTKNVDWGKKITVSVSM